MSRLLVLSLTGLLIAFASGLRCAAQLPARQPPTTQMRQPLIFRHADVDAAWAAAQKSGRPLLVFVTAADCFFCKKMVRQTLSHPQIALANNQRFETTLLHQDDRPELVEQLGVKAFPTTLVVAPSGSVVDGLRGFVEPQKFAERFLIDPRERQAAKQAVAPR